MRNKQVDKNILFVILYGIAKALEKILFNIKIENFSHMPKEGRVILCPNHTSTIDPIVLMINSKRTIHFLAKEELFKGKFFTWFFTKLFVISVKRNENDATAIKKCLRVLREDRVLGIFPEGTTVKHGQELIEPKAGALMLALQTKSPIIPVAIYGKYKFRGKITVRLGQPIYYDAYYSKKYKTDELIDITQKTVMQQIKMMLKDIKGANN
jgi:1-acyl-sn-glycerol-3-phosphate acyltransferase